MLLIAAFVRVVFSDVYKGRRRPTARLTARLRAEGLRCDSARLAELAAVLDVAVLQEDRPAAERRAWGQIAMCLAHAAGYRAKTTRRAIWISAACEPLQAVNC